MLIRAIMIHQTKIILEIIVYLEELSNVGVLLSFLNSTLIVAHIIAAIIGIITYIVKYEIVII